MRIAPVYKNGRSAKRPIQNHWVFPFTSELSFRRDLTIAREDVSQFKGLATYGVIAISPTPLCAAPYEWGRAKSVSFIIAIQLFTQM